MLHHTPSGLKYLYSIWHLVALGAKVANAAGKAGRAGRCQQRLLILHSVRARQDNEKGRESSMQAKGEGGSLQERGMSKPKAERS